ncbi:MAG: cytochrome c biogenesis protein CcsA [Deltaproteobacteria bacterium]|jgi:ABC-type transport system involved in cytochrome c biogenesis permease subunit|nr:cytochrome c biogenesis protein CcsA [Deltaproteobacteria bacterium]
MGQFHVTWGLYLILGPLSAALWLASAALVFRRSRAAAALLLAGTLVSLAFTAGLWLSLERPPFRTMGETRLWYSFFLSLCGLMAYRSFGHPWLLSFGAVTASVFAFVNVLKPEIHSKALMPALQSAYFIPHVTLYILSYALLASCAVGSAMVLVRRRRGEPEEGLLDLTDRLCRVGTGFLMLGLVLGALWAEEAWGGFWSWDPKETWAFLTCGAFLAYIHLRRSGRSGTWTMLTPLVAFVFLMITWLGVNYLPTAPQSVHMY